jgi:hypothetical protein
MGNIVLSNLSAAGFLGIVVILLLTGMIVPRRVYKDMERQRDFWEGEWRIIRDKEVERSETKLDANTETLRLVQQSFESLSKRRAS